jgi:hypothetical protein
MTDLAHASGYQLMTGFTKIVAFCAAKVALRDAAFAGAKGDYDKFTI